MTTLVDYILKYHHNFVRISFSLPQKNGKA